MSGLLTVTNPATGAVVGTVPTVDAVGARAAADAAAGALPAWGGRPARARADVLRSAADGLAADGDRLGALLSAETGKRRTEAVAEVRFAAEFLRWFAEEARRPPGAVLRNEDADRRHVTIRRPAGVVAVLTPWNFPVSIQARKVAPALAAGCTVVARPSEKAPLAVAGLFAHLWDAGVPRDALHLVHGPAAAVTDALLAHPAVRVVSFTGSTPVGRRIMATAATRVVRPLLELGGDAAFVVLADADLDAAVHGALAAKLRNNGQSCIAANRFLVHRSLAGAFTERLAAALDRVVVGDPGDGDPGLGPLIDTDRVAAVAALTDEAVAAGAERATSRVDVPAGGSYFAPALLTGVPDDARVVREEVFGPLAAVVPFDDPDEALQRANATETGLAAYVYTRDLGQAWRFAEQLEAGIVGVNAPTPAAVFTPMGGVKQAGLGREGGDLGLAEFEDVRAVTFGL